MDLDTVRQLKFYLPHDIVKIIDKFIKPKFLEITNIHLEKLTGDDFFSYYVDMTYLGKIKINKLCISPSFSTNDKNKIKLTGVNMFDNIMTPLFYDKKERVFTDNLARMDNIKLTSEEHLNVCEEFDKLFDFINSKIKIKSDN